MKIIYITNSLAVKAGIERTLTDKANYLANSGHQLTFVTYQQGNHPISYILHPSISYYDIDCKAYLLCRYPLLKRIVKTIKLKLEFRRKWISLVCQIVPDVIVTTTNSAEFMSEILAVRTCAPIIIESHIAYTVQANVSSLLRYLRWKYRLYVYRKCDLFIALTEGDAMYWKQHIPRVAKVDNPVTKYVDSPYLEKREEGRIISVGRMNNTQKRFDRLIDAFSTIAEKYPQWHIDIFGEGDLQKSLEQQIENLGLKSRVLIHPSTSNIYSEYLRSELFVLSSDYEGFGLVIVEAMACGVPVISTDCPFGPSEIIEDGLTGLLSKMEVCDLAKKIEWMITHSDLRKKMGQKGHEAAKRYQLDVVMNDWINIYRSVLPDE